MTDPKTKKWFYEHNNDFRRFVDSCCRSYGKSIDDILLYPTTEEYYLSLIEGGCNYKSEDEK